MATRYDHIQTLQSANMIAQGVTTDTVNKASATLTDEVIARFFVNPGFNGTLEWLEASLGFKVGSTEHDKIAGISAEWQIRTRGEAAFTKLADVIFVFPKVGYYNSLTRTSGGVGTLTKTGAGWSVNEWAGFLVTGNSTGGSISAAVVISNTTDTLTINTTQDLSGTQDFSISSVGEDSATCDVVYDAVVDTTDTVPFEIQLVASTDAAISTEWSLDSATMSIRCVGESV